MMVTELATGTNLHMFRQYFILRPRYYVVAKLPNNRKCSPSATIIRADKKQKYLQQQFKKSSNNYFSASTNYSAQLLSSQLKQH